MRRYEQLFDVPPGNSGQISSCSITITDDPEASTQEAFINGADESYVIKFSSQYCSIEAGDRRFGCLKCKVYTFFLLPTSLSLPLFLFPRDYMGRDEWNGDIHATV